MAAFWLGIWQNERRWFLFRLLCAGLWAVELFWVQALPFQAAPYIKYPLLVELARFYFDLVLTLALVFVLPRRFLIPLLALQMVAFPIVVAYANHFHRPLMLARASRELSEAWSLRHDLRYFLFEGSGVLLLILAFIAKSGCLIWSGGNLLPWRERLRSMLFVTPMYVVPVVLLQLTHLHLSVKPNAGMERVVFAYGYTLPWVCDGIANHSLQNHTLRAQALATQHFDRVSPVEEPLSIPSHLVVLQLESVDDKAIDAAVDGSPVMPCLREIKSRSIYFRIQAFHTTGSCDMDYAATTFTVPYPDLIPYLLPGMQYTNSMPAFVKSYGFKTYFYHGNSALFYGRGRVMEQLGFDHIFFKEQLAEKHLPASTIGFRDAAIFNCALEELLKEKRAYIFLITLDTHFPFTQLTAGEQQLFSSPRDGVQRYLNSLRYLDNCLQDFTRRLPDDTTVVIYGDHTTAMRSPMFTSDVQDGKEYVGCVIYQKGRDLSLSQRTRLQPLAMDGSLNLLDILSYIRHSLTANGQKLG